MGARKPSSFRQAQISPSRGNIEMEYIGWMGYVMSFVFIMNNREIEGIDV